jgi:Helix-turn-helix domain
LKIDSKLSFGELEMTHKGTSLETEIPEVEPLEIRKTGLYSPFPIHAYRILGLAKEHIAKDVLVCFISHLGEGKKNKMVKPSYKTICKETGRSNNSVAKGIRILEEFGYVRKKTIYEYRKKRNIYFIQESCYHVELMNERARFYLPVVGRCECGGAVRIGEYGVGGDGFHHYGCGALVHILKSVSNSQSIVENDYRQRRREISEIGNGTYFQSLQSTDSPLRGSEN